MRAGEIVHFKYPLDPSRDHVQRLTCVANAAPLTQAFRDAIDTLAMYDRTLLRDELGDTEFSGLAEWLSRKYPELL